MTTLGRNQPCHCGSGKKYKKCCLRNDEDVRRDEQDRQAFEYAVSQGIIDPLAGEEDWEVEPALEPSGEFFDEENGGELEFDDWYDDESEDEPAVTPGYLSHEQSEHLSEADMQCIDDWWDTFENISDQQELAAHISMIMDEHPSLVKELGLEVEPMYRLELSCSDDGDYQSFFQLVSRLHREFPEAYEAGFAGYDRFMVYWLLNAGKKEQIAEHLENFARFPGKGPDEMVEVINLLASSSCQDILKDFLPQVFQQVKTSPIMMEGEDILHPMMTLILAPFLDEGLGSFQVQELIKKLEPMSDLLSSAWFDEEALQTRIERILGVKGEWRLEDCTTYLKAIELYDDVNCSFMGWLYRNKSMDWCAAGYFSLHIRSYLYEALPGKKRPRSLFPLQAPDIALMYQRFIEQYYFANNAEMLGMLNGIYWFVEFLQELHLIEPEHVETSRKTCRELFGLIYEDAAREGFGAELWKTFPREF